MIYFETDESMMVGEKHGWLGNALDSSEEAHYNFNTLAVH
eukprot:SAG11_NODE_4870_length_1739_cov_2.784146_2_plen_40_part_00